ncbi:MAG: acyl carrier protein [Oscillospiraceae bacterium]|jgi:acyl carrier protein|nr:acyl carrier protein [Oscillospiraceae bacterium]MBQ2323186.1 acyl carrier protein [Oscillospiraceae bacterium]MBQ2606601.1 acyl carrier protein [Oscillospiraceae bacterium]MBQ5442004.1 acyl carrier protein [Oscillospiraceae bacterium]MBQ5566825.1 acyl carrier protein [Oscillospiraceae bacterium]
MANTKWTREQILEKTKKVIYDCVPELAGVELKEDSVVNTDMGMDSMNFILVICKLEAEFDMRIPNRQWSKISTLGELINAIEKYAK